MKTVYSIVGGVILTLALFVVVFNVTINEDKKVGSVAFGSSYAWTSTSSTGTFQLITDNPVVLGSVIISTDSAGTFVVNNATSTTDADLELVASFEATSAEGTYTYDAYLDRGLQIVGGASADGLITITYRQQ